MAQRMQPREAIDAQTNEGPNFFANATNFTIGHQVNNNIQHTNITVNNIGNQDIQTLLNPLPDASHLRNPKRSPPDAACLPGTRLPLLKSIKSWVGSSALLPTTKDDPTRILWLYGYVGCGKSALAQTISETFYAKKRLAASFFFFRGAGDRSRAGRFACTMAAQLMDAHAVPGTRGAIESAARRPGILTDSPMPVQFAHLFLDPYKAALRKPGRAMAQQMVSGPFLAVVDGLDECEDRDEVRGWLERLVGFFKTNPKAPLRFLISSRAEDHIRSPLEDEEAKPFVHLLDLSAHTTDEDIMSIVDETFKEAARASRVVRAYGAEWPSAEQRRQLVKHANGSLIAISTLLKFILGDTGDGKTPNHRLERALDLAVGLDELYVEILSRSQHLPHFQTIISTVVLVQSPLSIARLSKLLGIEKGGVTTVLVGLYAIVHVPEDNLAPVTLFHSSLREFLTAEDRSKAFYVPPTQHKVLAYRYFEHIGSPVSTASHSGTDLYLKNLAAFHWNKYVGLLRGKPTQLRQELRGLVSHLLCTYSQFEEFITSMVAFYTLLDRHWITSIAGKKQASTIGEFLEHFIYAKHAVPAPRFVQRIIDAVHGLIAVLTPRDLPESQGEELEGFWKDKTPPLTALPPLLPYHTPLLEMCVHYLFARREAPSRTPLVFLPESTPNTTSGQQKAIDASGYAFWSFGRHLAMAIKHDSGFRIMDAARVPGRKHPDTKGWKGDSWPFHFMALQRVIRSGVDPQEHFRLFKANFEMGALAVEGLFRANSVEAPALDAHWSFKSKPKPQRDGHYWVLGCNQQDFSILNLWAGYSMIALCFITSMERSHDDTTCALHCRFNRAKGQGGQA